MYSCSMLDLQLVENCFIDLQADTLSYQRNNSIQRRGKEEEWMEKRGKYKGQNAPNAIGGNKC